MKVAPLLLSDVSMTVFLSLLSLLRVISLAILVPARLFGHCQFLWADRNHLAAVASGLTRVTSPWMLRWRYHRPDDKERIDVVKLCAQFVGLPGSRERSAAQIQSFDLWDRDSLQRRYPAYSDRDSAACRNLPAASQNGVASVKSN